MATAPQPCSVEERDLEANQVSTHHSLSLSSPAKLTPTAFNWKQKLQLQEVAKDAEGPSKKPEILSFGNLADVPQLSQALQNLKAVEITDGFSSIDFISPTEELPELQATILDQSKKTSKSKEKIHNPIYKIQYPALFGSHKTGFLIEREKDKKKKRAEVVRFGKNKGEVHA